MSDRAPFSTVSFVRRRRNVRTSSVVPLLLCAAITASPGCADEQESLIVVRAPAWPDDGECFIDPDSPATMGRGYLDLSWQTPYLMPMHVANQLVSQDVSESNTNTDPGELQLRDAVVNLSLPQAPEVIEAMREQDPALVSFTAPLQSQSLPAGGELGISVEAVTQPAAIALLEQLEAFGADTTLTLLADVVVRASRTGNVVGKIGIVEARSFQFPIELCSGCLFTCNACEGGLCPSPPYGYSGFICGNAQDGPIWPAVCDGN